MSARPSSDRDGECNCDYNPSTTDGPREDCPFHGRPYAYWIERGDALVERLSRVEALADSCKQRAAKDRAAIEAGGLGLGQIERLETRAANYELVAQGITAALAGASA